MSQPCCIFIFAPSCNYSVSMLDLTTRQKYLEFQQKRVKEQMKNGTPQSLLIYLQSPKWYLVGFNSISAYSYLLLVIRPYSIQHVLLVSISYKMSEYSIFQLVSPKFFSSSLMYVSSLLWYAPLQSSLEFLLKLSSALFQNMLEGRICSWLYDPSDYFLFCHCTNVIKVFAHHPYVLAKCGSRSCSQHCQTYRCTYVRAFCNFFPIAVTNTVHICQSTFWIRQKTL